LLQRVYRLRVVSIVGPRAPRGIRAGVVCGLLVGVGIVAYTLWDAPVGLHRGSVVVQLLLLATSALRKAPQSRPIPARY
jgi:hypothetical protein